MTPFFVAIICVFIILAILVWDIYLYSDSTPRNSISQVVIDYSKDFPIIPWCIGFFMGILTGHWYG